MTLLDIHSDDKLKIMINLPNQDLIDIIIRQHKEPRINVLHTIRVQACQSESYPSVCG